MSTGERKLPRACKEPPVWHDDGNAFMCMGCGAITKRTRMNPYPEIKHKVKK